MGATKQASKLADLLRYNLKTVRSYLLKEEFQQFWCYQSWYLGRKVSGWVVPEPVEGWCTKAMRSKIEPMKKVVGQLRRHRPLLLNWFRANGQFSNGVAESFNNKAKLTTKKAYGLRTYRAKEIALYHALGNLPAPKVAHKFF